jgi:hypothetical protein
VESEEVPTRLTQQEEPFSITRIALNDCVTQYKERKKKKKKEIRSPVSRNVFSTIARLSVTNNA